MVEQAVSSEPVSGVWAAKFPVKQGKTGNFNVFGQNNEFLGRINSSNQSVSHDFPKNRNREFNWRIREFSQRNREFEPGSR